MPLDLAYGKQEEILSAGADGGRFEISSVQIFVIPFFFLRNIPSKCYCWVYTVTECTYKKTFANFIEIFKIIEIFRISVAIIFKTAMNYKRQV